MTYLKKNGTSSLYRFEDLRPDHRKNRNTNRRPKMAEPNTATMTDEDRQTRSELFWDERHRRQDLGSRATLRTRQTKRGCRCGKSGSKCTRCNKMGHSEEVCWAKNVGKLGIEPWQNEKETEKGRQAKDQSRNESDDQREYSHMATDFTLTDRKTWIADSGTTSHIAVDRRIFSDYQTLTDASLTRIGDRRPKFGKGIVYHRLNYFIGIGKKNRLYHDAYSLPREPAYLTTTPLTRETWHNHLGIPALQRIYSDEYVIGLIIDKSTEIAIYCHMAYLRNRAPTRALRGKTACKAWTNEEPDLFEGFENGPQAIKHYIAYKRPVGISRNFAWNTKSPPLPQFAIILPLEGENNTSGNRQSIATPKYGDTAPATTPETRIQAAPSTFIPSITVTAPEPERRELPARSTRSDVKDYRIAAGMNPRTPAVRQSEPPSSTPRDAIPASATSTSGPTSEVSHFTASLAPE